jgi:rhodanese-related sulfurtransferase
MEKPEIDVTPHAGLLTGGAVPLLDVRMPDEYEEAHVPGAVLVPLPELPDRLADVPQGDVVYVICRSGARSAKAVEILVAAGLDAANVAGGTMAWVDSGRDVATGSEPG